MPKEEEFFTPTDIGSSQQYPETAMSANDIVRNRLQIADKQLEPEKQVHQVIINRNTQLGYIQRQDADIYSQKFQCARYIFNISDEDGACVFKPVHNILQEEINFDLVLSNSIDGRGRTIAVTQMKKEEFKDTTPRSPFAPFTSNKDK